MTAAAAVAADNWTDLASEIEEVEIDLLEDSPFNSRVLRDDEKLRELAESIRRSGVQQPIIVRHVEVEGDVVKFEIVAGHRRVRAAKLAGRKTVPAITRDLTDDQARELQIVENLQRADLPPLEEARAFHEAMTFAEGKMLDVQTLAARLGKSPVYVNRRLSLLDAIPPVQEALTNGFIEVGHALELARLDDGEQQRLCYWLGIVIEAGVQIEDAEKDGREIADDKVGLPTSKSVLELRKYIGSTTLRVLGDAPFDPNDPSLVEAAGSCADCLKRSGLSPLLFNDLAGDDVCTDRSCFDGKVKALIARKIDDAKKAKAQLHQITQNWVNGKGQLHFAHHVTEADNKRCGFLVEAIHIDGRTAGKVVEICLGPDCKVHAGRGVKDSAAKPPTEKEKAERKALLAKVKVEKAYRLALFKELVAKPIDPVPTDHMVQELVAFALTRIDSTKRDFVAETLGWPKEVFSWMSNGPIARLNTISQAEAIRIALVALEANELTVHEYDILPKSSLSKHEELGLEKVARLIGVDAQKVRASFEPQPPKQAQKKSVAKKATKKAPAKKAAKRPTNKDPFVGSLKKKAVKR